MSETKLEIIGSRELREIIGKFDFPKACQALRGCGWKFEGATDSPSAAELLKIATHLCEEALRDKREGLEMCQGPIWVRVKHSEGRVFTVEMSLVPVWSYCVGIRENQWVSAP